MINKMVHTLQKHTPSNGCPVSTTDTTILLTFNPSQNVFEQVLKLGLPLCHPDSDTEHIKDDLPMPLLEEKVAKAWRRML